MFIRTKTVKQKGKAYQYHQVVENYRVNGKIRQKIIFSLGKDIDTKSVAKLTECLSDLVPDIELINLKADNPEISPVWSKEYGLPFVYKRLSEDCGLDKIISEIKSKHKIQFDLVKVVFSLILNRIMEPASEHKTANHWNKKIYDEYVEGIDLQHLYRGVKIISKHKEEIEEKLFLKERNLFNQSIDLAFFDTTSTYLSGEMSEALAQYGYSKDKRPDKKQILVGCILGSNNLPIGCEIWPGNTADVTAMSNIIKSVQKRFSISKIILVGDGGMNSEDNRKSLANSNLEYILGTRLGSSKDVKNYLKEHSPLTFEGSITEENKNELAYKEATINNRRYAIVYNREEAKRQEAIRSQITEKLKSQINQSGIKDLIKNKGQKKYLKINNENNQLITLNQEKIDEEKIYDGIFVCETNNTTLSIEQIIRQYKNLWQVERAFRNLKDIIEMRPIYHKKDEMVTGHIFISFLALYLEMYLKNRLAKKGINDAERISELINEIRAIKAVKIQVKDKVSVMRTEMGSGASEFFKTLSIRPPDRMVKKWKSRKT